MKTPFSNPMKNAKLGKRVDFEYYASQAKQVHLAGSFNNWNPASTPLKRERDGKWKTSLLLPPGRYEYRYLVDDEWQNDQRPVECVPNAYGSWNCVVEVA